MKFMRRLSRVADSSNYILLRSEESKSSRKKTESSRVRKLRMSSAMVPEGHLPVFVGEEMERFVVSAKLLNHPVLLELLDNSAQVYGYQQKGVLRIPCTVFFFEQVPEAIRLGGGAAASGDSLLLINLKLSRSPLCFEFT